MTILKLIIMCAGSFCIGFFSKPVFGLVVYTPNQGIDIKNVLILSVIILIWDFIVFAISWFIEFMKEYKIIIIKR